MNASPSAAGRKASFVAAAKVNIVAAAKASIVAEGEGEYRRGGEGGFFGRGGEGRFPGGGNVESGLRTIRRVRTSMIGRIPLSTREKVGITAPLRSPAPHPGPGPDPHPWLHPAPNPTPGLGPSPHPYPWVHPAPNPTPGPGPCPHPYPWLHPAPNPTPGPGPGPDPHPWPHPAPNPTQVRGPTRIGITGTGPTIGTTAGHNGLGAWGTGFATGVAAATPWSWGYWPYNNPYCSAPVVVGDTTVDYSQPIVLASPPVTVVQSASQSAGAPAAGNQPAPTDRAIGLLDSARATFAQGDYTAALTECDQAVARLPNSAVAHEFRGLALFALHRYTEAAGPVYAVLSVGPGWDWATLSSFYPRPDVYAGQLRAWSSTWRPTGTWPKRGSCWRTTT